MSEHRLSRPGASSEASIDAGSPNPAPVARQSGGPAKGRSAHGPDCQCTRCRGFEKGHTLSLRHGAYRSPARLGEEIAEIADELVPLVPVYTESDSVATELLALTLRRIARGEPLVAAAEDAGDLEQAKALRSDQRGWVRDATRLLELLGMVPVARARLGLDLTRAKGEALKAHLADRYADQEATS